MAWIRVIDEYSAGGRLAQLYKGIKQAAGSVANILSIHSLRPDTLSGHLAFYKSVMHSPGELSQREREMIAVAVSITNHCHY